MSLFWFILFSYSVYFKKVDIPEEFADKITIQSIVFLSHDQLFIEKR